MIVCWYHREAECFMVDSAKSSDLDSSIDFSLLESVLYSRIHFSTPIIDLCTTKELSAESFFDICQTQSPLFFYRYIVFAKLCKCGWIVTSGADVGCDYCLYPTDVDTSHSLCLVTLEYPDDIAQIDSACVHSLEFTPFHWRLAESFSFPQSSKSISKISLHWRDVQRLSRLSGIRKKYWNRASLHSSCTIQCHTYSEMIKLERNSSLSLIQFQHWDPANPLKDDVKSVWKRCFVCL